MSEDILVCVYILVLDVCLASKHSCRLKTIDTTRLSLLKLSKHLIKGKISRFQRFFRDTAEHCGWCVSAILSSYEP